ncbi:MULTISPECIES: helix-turn-helix domain-containing protein [unclassified Nocardiopsis]|uniref:helix-turn-helix domain-containing protein n=1 Tax=unclassified Nocardiopsis TaxID=2649073 RepID=UPI00135C65B2|nr:MULTISPECIES: helix-turn-helix domain-containing protein [unclassified Nocardiopsis]
MESQEEPQSFGHLLLRYRLRAELTQQELADFSTISVRAIRDLEHGRARQPRRDTVRLLADGLHLNDRDRVCLEDAAGRRPGRSRLRAGRSGSATAPPVPRTPLIGRHGELRSLTEGLSATAHRITALVGAPGTGKSRLAVEAAVRLHRELDLPVLWTTASSHGFLAHEPDRSAVDLPGPVVDALYGTGEDTGPLDALADSVGDEPVLLVLDDPRPGPLSPQPVADLLSVCPNLRILATSRGSHGLADERVFLLDPPPTGDAVEILRASMDETAPLAAPNGADDGVLARICGLVDHLPGALAAVSTWSAVYDTATLLSCLGEDPLPLLAPLSGTGADIGDGFSLALRQNPPEQTAILRLLCESPLGETAAGIAQATGLSLTDCGRALASLITRGLVHRDREATDSRFRAFRLVSVLCASTTSPTEHMEFAS